MKIFIVTIATAAITAGLVALPASGTHKSTSVKVKTIATGKGNRIPVGARLNSNLKGRVLHYQWLRCNRHGKQCMKIKGATHKFYIVRTADIGHTLRIRATLQGSTTVESAPTDIVGRPLPVNTAIPVITDDGAGGGNVGAPTTVVVGDNLTGSNGTWKHAVRFTYQWDDCTTTCAPIPGATNTTYTVQDSDVGDTIVFVVTAYNF